MYIGADGYRSAVSRPCREGRQRGRVAQRRLQRPQRLRSGPAHSFPLQLNTQETPYRALDGNEQGGGGGI